MGFTVGLAVASVLLSAAGFGFRLLFGETLSEVSRQAIVVIPAFVIGIPLLVWLCALILNKTHRLNIHPRNALTLGWLLSVVAMLSVMGVYS